MSRWRARLFLVAWTALLAAILVPWGDVTNHTHWGKVAWIPFGPPFRPFDIVANVLVFVPFGASWKQSGFHSSKLQLGAALVAAGVLSIGAEWLQVYSHSRIPSATDVVTNLLGALAGWWWAGR